MIAAGASCAKRIFTSPLQNLRSLIPDEAHLQAVRLHLNMPPADYMPVNCFHGHSLAGDKWLFLSCPRLKGNAMTWRHDTLVQVLADWGRRLGGSVRVEPRLVFNRPQDNDQHRVDLEVVSADSHSWSTSRSCTRQRALISAADRPSCH